MLFCINYLAFLRSYEKNLKTKKLHFIPIVYYRVFWYIIYIIVYTQSVSILRAYEKQFFILY